MNSLLSFVQNSTDRKESETEALPSVLPRGLLETNLGIPVMVVCTHTDVIVIVLHSSHTQAKSKTLTSLKVDFIQHALRSHCLFCISIHSFRCRRIFSHLSEHRHTDELVHCD